MSSSDTTKSHHHNHQPNLLHHHNHHHHQHQHHHQSDGKKPIVSKRNNYNLLAAPQLTASLGPSSSNSNISGEISSAISSTQPTQKQQQKQPQLITTNKNIMATNSAVPMGPNDLEHLKNELEHEKKNRTQIQNDYADLKRQMEEFTNNVDESRKNPVSKYDTLIAKQNYFNDTLTKQIAESKDKLKDMSASLKHIQACDCNIHMRDLMIDYHCISKSLPNNLHCSLDDKKCHPSTQSHLPPPTQLQPQPQLSSQPPPPPPHHHHHHHHHEQHHNNNHHNHNHHHNNENEMAVVDPESDLAKEIRRFQRMQIDLKSNLDRLQWRLDCESKIYHSVYDQYQKLQMDLYYLKNLNEKGGPRDMWL